MKLSSSLTKDEAEVIASYAKEIKATSIKAWRSTICGDVWGFVHNGKTAKCGWVRALNSWADTHPSWMEKQAFWCVNQIELDCSGIPGSIKADVGDQLEFDFDKNKG